MSLTLNLRKKIHRKQWEPLFTPLPVATAAGVGFAKDKLNLGDGNQAYMFTAQTTSYLFAAGEEGFGALLASPATGTFGLGACGFVHASGTTGTASAGSTTTLTTPATIVRDLRGYRVRITGGTNAGQERIIASNTLGANSVITVQDAFPSACDATSVFLLLTNRYWYYVPGATSGFAVYDFALNTWTAKSVASGPAFTATEGVLIGTPSQECVTDFGTATGSQSSTTLQDTSRAWTINQWANTLVKIISGTGVGQYRVAASNTANTITVNAAWSVTPDSTSVYEVGSFSAGVASAGAATTLTVSGGSSYAANMLTNYQLRIVAGTGAGQVRTISSNTSGTGSVITVSAAWATNPDATSYFVVEGNDDNIYALGNSVVALFKYSISGNTWATITPGAARGTVPGAGMTASYIALANDPSWMAQTGPANATTYRQNGRYIYSFRGAAAANAPLDIYDIVGNTWISSAPYGGATNESFSTGTSAADMDGYIYIQKDATGRFFRFDTIKNELIPINTNAITQGAAISGNRMFIDKYFDKTNGKSARFIYWAVNTSTALFRMLEI